MKSVSNCIFVRDARLTLAMGTMRVGLGLHTHISFWFEVRAPPFTFAFVRPEIVEFEWRGAGGRAEAD